VQCDGVAIDRAALASPLRLDPGTHALQATARGRRPFRKTFVLVDGSAPLAIDVDLPPSPSNDDPDRPNTEPAPPAPPPSGGSQPTLAIVVGGVGVVGLGVGTVFGLTAISKWDRARAGCTSGNTGCSSDAIALEQDVRRDALVSTIAFGVGVAAVAGAAFLY